MTDNQLLTAQESAKLAGVPYTTFQYHVLHGNVPEAMLVGKRYLYRREDIVLWKKPAAKKRGPKPTEPAFNLTQH